MTDNKQKIKDLVIDMLDRSYDKSVLSIDKILDSGCIDIDAWDENNGRMLVPKAIVMALLDYEKDQWSPSKRISSYKQVTKDFKNIRNFL
jgi:hypothetical protein